MRCYKCNSVLTDSDYCMKCGADVSVYKIVVKASNSYYNLGLAKAQIRDLSGALIALRTSLKINKNNIKARNLLGLVYFEMGEVALALSEWVISVNLKPDKNVATVYIKKVKANPNKLEVLNQAAKKYNFSLDKAMEDGIDVALIQLKKVVSMNPKFIKAYLLLALLYMKKEDSERASKLLKRVLKIDRNNTLAIRYLDEINKTGIASEASTEDDYYAGKKKLKGGLSGHDVILPRNSYKEPSSGVFTVVYILLGVIIGVAIVWFLVVPAKLQSAQYENNQTIKNYSDDLSANSGKINELEEQITELNTQLESAKTELESYKGDTGATAMYASLIDAASAYVDDDFETAATRLAEIDVTQLPTDTAKALYTTMEDNCSGGARTFYLAGVNAYNQKNYVDAITYLERAYSFDDTTVETPYYLAMSYTEINDTDNAKKYIDIVNTKFGNTTFAAQMNELLKDKDNNNE